MTIRHSTVFLTAAGLALGAFAAGNAGNDGNAGRGGAAGSASQAAAVSNATACGQACPKAQDACPKADAKGCPGGGQACPAQECTSSATKAGREAAPKAPAAPSSRESADAGFRPSAYPNVNVRFLPGPSPSPAARNASIYVRPGVDPSVVRRGGPSVLSAQTMSSAQSVQKLPDGRIRMIAGPSDINYSIARRQPSGRITVGCGAAAGDRPTHHEHADAAKGATK